MTLCWVTQKDYKRYWNLEPVPVLEPLPIPSIPVERRSGQERRLVSDRRWDRSQGRRYRLADRRRPFADRAFADRA